jgi:tyrosine-protein phosphatase YwqE
MINAAIAQNMLVLANKRNAEQLSRLEKIKEYSASICSILESPSAFIATDIMKESYQNTIITIQKDLNILMVEATHHVMWLKWQVNTIPAEDLNPMIAYIEPETDTSVLYAHELLNKFTTLQK